MSDKFGYLYEATTTSYIRRGWRKIGITKDVNRRMKQLASNSGSPEEYLCHNWYKFENIDEAKSVEKYIHDELEGLGLRVHKRREFFAYPANFYISDIVNEAADKLEIKSLSNYQLQYQEGDIDVGLLLPCRFFLLSDESVFENFRIWGQRSFSTAINIVGYQNDIFISRLFKFLEKPEYRFKSYLRDFDTEPYLLARMKNSHDPEIERIRLELESNTKEEIEDYFYYDKNWRDKIGEFREHDY